MRQGLREELTSRNISRYDEHRLFLGLLCVYFRDFADLGTL